MAAPPPRFVILAAGSLAEIAAQANALDPAYGPVGRPFVADTAGEPVAWAFELKPAGDPLVRKVMGDP